MKKKKTRYIISLAAGALIFAGCQRELLPEGDVNFGDGQIRYSVNNVGVKSSVDETVSTGSLSLVSRDGKLTVPVTCEVSEGIDLLSGSVETKGTLINTSGDDEPLPSDINFTVSAYKGSTPQFENMAATKSGDYWTMDPPQYWPLSTNLTFYAYTNAGSNTVAQTATSQTLSYTVTGDDAAAHKDLMLGYYKGYGDNKGIAEMRFDHPLTAVRFKQGEFVDVDCIKSITISGLASGGTVTMDANGVIGNWTVSGTEEYKTEVSLSGGGTALGVEESSQLIGTDSEGKYNGAFLLIPQKLSDHKVTVTAVLTIGTDDVIVSADITSGEWEAGKTNTYTLGYDPHTYEYFFELSAEKIFFLSAPSEKKDVELISKKVDENGVVKPVDWYIESVQVGTSEPLPIGRKTFDPIGGLSSSWTSGESPVSSTLSITAAKRDFVESPSPGAHDYWLNQNPKRVDYLGWSPENWGSGGNDQGTIDLSKMDFSKDNPTDAINAHEMTTANCYIIRHAGTYKLPLVYGNAVKGGVEYTDAYAPTMAVGGDKFLSPFKNHLDKVITSPFIENNTDCGGSGLKCAVVWQDKAEVVKSLQIVGESSDSYTASNVRYLQFSISQEDICQNNALICVYKDKEGGTAGQYDTGEAVWSWHIWTTNDPALLTPAIPVFNFPDPESIEYDFFPLNCLGWTDTKTAPSKEDVKIVVVQPEGDNRITLTVKQNSVYMGSVSCYYQWGRKDPMCPTDSPIVGSFKVPDNYTQTTLADAICNPDRIYYTDNNKNWCIQMYNNLWTGKKSKAGLFFNQDSDMIKTIYDPSPVGYKMPASKAFTGFSTTGGTVDKNISKWNIYGDFNNGGNFYTKPGKEGDYIFFPCPALRGKVGKVDNHQIGQQGYYWSAVPYSDKNGQNLTIWRDGTLCVPSASNGLSVAFSVRPVLETVPTE